MFDSEREHRDFWYDSPYAHAVHQAIVNAIDRGDETSEWLLTDFDTFVRNPNYKGVRSNNNPSLQSSLGFLLDERRLNVTITRPKHFLFIIGNS